MEGSDYTAYRERRALAISALITGAGVTLFVLAIGFWLLNIYFLLLGSSANTPLSATFGAASLILLGLSRVGLSLADKYSDERDQFRKGREGEQRAVEILRASLNNAWMLIQNLEWPNRHWGDIDLLLIGPGGIWALEVKAYGRPTRNIGARWEYRRRRGWHSVRKSPGKQASCNAARLREYLVGRGVPIKWVQPIVVWAGEEDKLTLSDSPVPVWKLSEMADRIEELWREQRLSAEQVEQCRAILTQLIEQTNGKGVTNQKRTSAKTDPQRKSMEEKNPSSLHTIESASSSGPGAIQ